MADFAAKIDALLQDDMSQIQHDQAQRRKALRLARLLCTQLESPMDHILRMSWQEPQYKAALKICIDLKVFDIIGKGAADFVSVADIATATGAEPALLHRVLRHLASMAALRERDPDCYGLTPLTEALRRPEIASGVQCWFDIAAPTMSSLPNFLAESGYKDPVNANPCNWQMAKNTKLNFFDYMNENPLELANFAQHMSSYASDRGSWLDLYPMDRLWHGASVNSPILVDVGGSLGHDAKKFRQRYPQKTGEVVVQDLPLVVAQAEPDPSIQMMAHDFWTEQPVKGARAYFLHSVLHDWTDDEVVVILENLKPAFKRGYSKLLISECVIPVTGADPLATGLDLNMMGVFSSRERTEQNWEDLLVKAGFQIVQIWTDTTISYESIIEAELA